MKELTTLDMLNWLNAIGTSMTEAIRERILRDEARIAELTNDRDEAMEYVKDLKWEAVCQIR